MPLRDHFRPPIDNLASWEGFHGQWPAVIVQHLRKQLPAGYVALLALIGHSDPTLGAEPANLYAVSCRCVEKGKQTLLEAWSHVLALGQPLPILPLWLTEDVAVPLDLEQNYESACHVLWIA